MEYYFHVNPPEQRGKKRNKKSRATFCGIITTNVDNTKTYLQIGMSYVHSIDQFYRKIGRIKAKGAAMSKRHFSYDISNIAEKNHNDYFVQCCRQICDIAGIQHDYIRRKKRERKSNEFVIV